jgi:hypothetical protein
MPAASICFIGIHADATALELRGRALLGDDEAAARPAAIRGTTEPP